MDTLIGMHDQWRISSSELRDRVHTQLNLQIMDAYTEFYSTYSSVQFSKKNKDSYLRYPPQEVENQISELFT